MKKIDIDNSEISDNEALKLKDFDKVMEKFSGLKKPFYQSSIAKIGSIILTTVSILAVYQLTLDDTPKETFNNSSYLATYNSPVNKKVEHENIEAIINIDESLTLSTQSGTKITVAANALVDSLGDLITGDVTFKYKEFLDQKDIFLSGIPMNYDSSGTEMNFESGGMFELLAYQNNQPIYIASEKNIQINLASKQVGDNFNLYYYSSAASKWVLKGKDENGFNKKDVSLVNEALKKSPEYMSLQALQEEKLLKNIQVKKLKDSKPILPDLANKNYYSFTINVDYKDFPELSAFKELKFQVSTKEKNFKPEYAQESWSDVKISHGTTRAEYNTCFVNQKHGEVCFLTNPVFGKSAIKKAEVVYEKLLAEYQTKKDSLKSRNKAIRKEIAKRSKRLNDQRRIELNRRAANSATVVENRITRTFQIANFGIWNSDCPQKLPTEAIVKAIFKDNKGSTIKIGTLYLVLKERNQVISLNPETIAEGIRYNPNEDCMLWGVTNDKKNVAIFRSEQFKEIKDADETFTFEMNLINSKEFVSYSTETIFNL